jgi:hypothetical protein
VKVDTVAKEKMDLGMFYLRNTSVSPSDVFPKDMPDKICANLLAKARSATTSIAILFIPGGPQSSNMRLSWQSPIILPKETLVSSTSIIL